MNLADSPITPPIAFFATNLTPTDLGGATMLDVPPSRRTVSAKATRCVAGHAVRAIPGERPVTADLSQRDTRSRHNGGVGQEKKGLREFPGNPKRGTQAADAAAQKTQLRGASRAFAVSVTSVSSVVKSEKPEPQRTQRSQRRVSARPRQRVLCVLVRQEVSPCLVN